MDWIRKHVLENHIIVALIFIGILSLAWQIHEVLVFIFWAYVLACSLVPVIHWGERHQISKGPAVVISYLTLVFLFIILVVPLFTQIVREFAVLELHLPDYIQKINQSLGMEMSISYVLNFLRSDPQTVGTNALNIASKIFGGIFSLLAALVISVYFSLDKDRIENGIISFFNKTEQPIIEQTLSKVESKLGAWVRGQLFLCFIVGLATWIMLTIIGLPFAIPLAVIAGLLEAIPMVGPIISAVPAVLIGLTVSPVTAVLTIGIYVLVQQLENHILVPKVMQKVLGLNPLLVIIAITTGGKLLGATGALMAIPLTVIGVTIWQSLRNN